jgi:hypothetical protein
MSEYITALGTTTMRLKTYKHPPPNMPLEANSADIIRELQQSCDVFEQKLTEQARHMAWVSTSTMVLCLYTSERCLSL